MSVDTNTLNELRKAQDLPEGVFRNKDFYEGFQEGINTAIILANGSDSRSEISDNELLQNIAVTLCLANCPACKGDATKCAYGIENYGEDAKQVLEAIRPYLRLAVQVPKP